MSNSTAFKMPVVGSDEYNVLVESWKQKPVSWGTLKAISYRFRTIGDWSHLPLSEQDRKVLSFRSIRNDQGHLVNVDRAKGYTQWQGHQLIELLDRVSAMGATTTEKAAPKPPVAESKVKPAKWVAGSNGNGGTVAINTETVPFLVDGMFVRVRLENGDIENMRVNVSGKRVYLGAVK